MKLKITDEKLIELAKRKYENNHGFGFAGSENGYKDGFRAAEAHHQATVDKLMEIIKIQNEFMKSCIYDDTGRSYENADEVSMEAFRVSEKIARLEKELDK